MEVRTIRFDEHGDKRGTLVSLEQLKDVPFEIKRVYYMYHTVPEARRGCHAHKNLRQVLVCVSGSCSVLLDDGRERAEVHLDSPNKGLVVESCVWREMFGFSESAVLMVLASELYDESDYIRDYKDFLGYVGGQG